MSYIILARKYRPQKFCDLTGQETISKILQAAVEQGRIAPAYLFSGPRGTGKTTTARIFAKSLNCRQNKENQKPEPCDQCSSCQEIVRGSSLDVLELDAASHTQVEKIREVIINSVAFAPVRDRYKIFIIDEVHMLSHHSFNALLKTLEEPPPHVVFILATTEYHKIPVTILSRCQKFRFLPLTQAQVFAALTKIARLENISISEDAVALLTKSAAGSMRDALSLLDQMISHLPAKKDSADTKSYSPIERSQVETVLGTGQEQFLTQFLQRVAAKDAKSVLELIGDLRKEGQDISYFLKEVRESYRQMLIEKCGYRETDLLPSGPKLPADRFSLEQILRAIQILTKCAEQMRWNDLPHIVFECAAVRLCQETVDVQDMITRLKKLEGSLGNHPIAQAPTVEKNPVDSEVVKKAASASPQNGSDGVDGNLGWKNVLAALQETKPFLFQAVEKAVARWENGVLELAFYKPFLFSSAKKSVSTLENLLSEAMKKKVSVRLKLDESSRTVRDQKDSDKSGEVGEESGLGEETTALPTDEEESSSAFSDDFLEPAGQDKKKENVHIEDEGLQKILQFFPGDVRKVVPSPSASNLKP
ncbi:MAG: DNA polymerase III subunit gamma/tau [Elusimicrobia bacterium]|nr:DNA polymerase III subunit gamma/tau [Elusimicrobiota bacterium]